MNPSGPFVAPTLMGIINASPESFSGNSVVGDGSVALADQMIADGAGILDLGAQSLRTDQAEIDVVDERARLLPVLTSIHAAHPEVDLSVDTYRYEVAAAAVEAGASIINDPSGLSDPRLLELAVDAGCRLVITYNRAVPKQRLTAEQLVDDVVADCLAFSAPVLQRLADAGVSGDQVLFDPGVDLGKSPDQTIAVLRSMDQIRDALGGPSVLWALSRKDFIGALLERTPRGRDAGTLAALASVTYQSGDVVRVHDVRAASDLFRVRAALHDGVSGPLDLPPRLRHEPA